MIVQRKMQKKVNTRKIKAEERRIQILDTALNVFGTKGFKESSIKDIAEAAGISQGLMYHYFSSKEELLKATIEQYGFMPQLRQILQNNRDLTVDAVFRNIAGAFLEVLDNRKMLISILIREVDSNPQVTKAWSDLCQNGVRLIREYLDDHIRSGELRPHNTEVTARSLFGIMFMYHFTKDVFQFSRISREEFIEGVLSNNLYGIGRK